MMSSDGIPEGFVFSGPVNVISQGQVLLSGGKDIAKTHILDGKVEDAAGVWEVTLGFFKPEDWQANGWAAQVVYILGQEMFSNKEEAFAYRRALRDAWDLPKFP